MKVLMFGWELPPVISGGLGTACKGIADSLALQKDEYPEKNSIDLTFVIPNAMDEKPLLNSKINVVYADSIKFEKAQNELSEKQIKHISPYYTSHETYSKNYEFIQHKDSILRYVGNYGNDLLQQILNYSYRGEKIAKEGDFDIIHAHDWMTFEAGIRAKDAIGKPLVVHIHSTEYDRSGSNANIDIVKLEKKGMERADRIIAVSRYTKNMIISKYGIDEKKITVVYNAAERQERLSLYRITRNPNEKIVLFLGRITQQKGPEYFLEAAAKVINKKNNIRFVMCGTGDLMPKTIEKMASLDIADKFHFTGFLNNLEVEKIYSMSDLYVMPSISEPFGITPFEALLYDVPVIISKQSGAAELLNCAYQVDFWDTEKLSSIIIEILENDDLRNESVKKCKEEIKDLTWAKAAESITQIYKELIPEMNHTL